MTEKTQKKNVWIDQDGNEVPTKYVSKQQRDEHRNVNKYIKKAKKLHDELKKFKADLLATCDYLYAEKLKEANLSKQSRKGFYTLTTFDKQCKIEIRVQEKIEFGDEIEMAQAKIEEYLSKKLAGQDDEVRKIVDFAFQPTSNKRLDTKRIFGLFGLNIKDPTWKEAMELISQSINRNVSKRHARFYEKDQEGEYQPIDLNFSSI